MKLLVSTRSVKTRVDLHGVLCTPVLAQETRVHVSKQQGRHFLGHWFHAVVYFVRGIALYDGHDAAAHVHCVVVLPCYTMPQPARPKDKVFVPNKLRPTMGLANKWGES